MNLFNSCLKIRHVTAKHLAYAKLFCRHGDNNYQYLYWYQQKSNGGSLELIGILNYGIASHKDKFKPRFNITGNAKEDAFLLISRISVEDTAVYFCAASLHSYTVPFNH
uniref:Immunoglobulin V-set domain-containing protein n=1 Tax=Cyprinus carpio TaxID=7962 RepID=A0A8C1T5U3_CYPCA